MSHECCSNSFCLMYDVIKSCAVSIYFCGDKQYSHHGYATHLYRCHSNFSFSSLLLLEKSSGFMLWPPANFTISQKALNASLCLYLFIHVYAAAESSAAVIGGIPTVTSGPAGVVAVVTEKILRGTCSCVLRHHHSSHSSPN